MIDDTTDWFPGDVKPVHVGYYERTYTTVLVAPDPDQPDREPTLATYLDYWDGESWFYGRGADHCLDQHLKWRGKTQPQTADWSAA